MFIEAEFASPGGMGWSGSYMRLSVLFVPVAANGQPLQETPALLVQLPSVGRFLFSSVK